MHGGHSRGFPCLFFFQAEDGIRDKLVTGVQTCALPISQADTDVGEPARIRLALVELPAPGAAGVEEDRAADAEEAEGVPVGVDALLQREEHADRKSVV